MSGWSRQSVTGADYECRACRKRYRIQHHVCPKCSSFCVDTVADVERCYDSLIH